jgi:glutamate dehydrogenase
MNAKSTTAYSTLHQSLIDAILGTAKAKKLSASQRGFAQQFYALTTVSDLEEIEPASAANIAINYEAFASVRKAGTPKLSVSVGKSPFSGRLRTVIMAINDDMPFLVDSLSGLINAQGLTIYRVLHPILAVKRDAKGKLTGFERPDTAPASWARESMIYIECSPLPVNLTPEDLTEHMQSAFQHVAYAVADWKPMQARMQQLIGDYASASKGNSAADTREIHDLLSWLASNHFIFLGLAEYVPDSKGSLVQKKGSALGVYHLPAEQDGAIEYANTATTTDAISVLKASQLSRVHRRVPMDYIVLKRTDAKGKAAGETRILGLFTSTVYYRETDQIPFIRRKAARVMARAGFSPSSHSGKALKTTLEFLPRDELFQMDEESLFRMAMRIVSLEAKPQVRIFIRRDAFERFISAMVYVPREQFSTAVREEIVRVLETTYAGKFTAFYTQVTDSPLARVTIQIETTPGAIPQVDEDELERKIIALASRWSDALRDAIIHRLGHDQGEQLAQSYANAFPPAYINTHSAQAAAFDIRRVQECATGDGLALELFRAKGDAADQLHLKCYSRDLKLELSNIIPLLENMGCIVVDATPYIITPLAPLPPVLLRDFTLRVPSAVGMDIDTAKARIEDAIERIWRAQTDNDTLNALIFSAGLSARDVEILRAYSRYLQQLNFPYSQPFIAQALGQHAGIARQLVQLFHARFNPATKKRDELQQTLKTEIEAALEAVTNLAEDRVIRRMLALMFASLRTNFYQTDAAGNAKPYLSIKIRSRDVPDMPLPVPYAEIFVTSMRMEGIHLRGGAVARGGLRWSDRPEDFRTEVLGLVKAQMVKNAVIVPQGAKGGFILRRPPAERDAFMAEGVECYKMFLRGLLDITDNIVTGKLVAPTNTVRHDGDDPYLVVAADKGTATFSDTANGVAADYQFWLGDAFASGGSAGYDHKAMAITARGGWVSVERHFREMGKDIAHENFTAIGVGDMSGDVFGNGMLLSNTMQLIAAFNHRHIFVDPTPDAAKSFAERQRLFALPRSGWNDYDAKLISKGGGVFERSAKSIALTPEMRAALGTDATKATPDELMRIILKAPVDLLWNGGIGTYVKAASETHEQVGDRANNAVRVNGAELRCKIVGEGGNLGFTQRGRIEYARSGGRINTDAIDNSGGVDCSDHEVNIKIALNAALQAGKTTRAKRDALLKKMTDEVAHLVLIDNKLQTQAISIAELQGTAILEPAEQLITTLEGTGILNREVEFLPDARSFGELRASKAGLTRPEIAVLLAYAKMSLSLELKESTLLDAPYFEQDLLRYFPDAMEKPYGEDIRRHRLRREIVATMITNSIVNRTGFSFAHSLMRATGLGAGDIAQAYVATRDAFALRALWKDIEALDGKVDAVLQSRLFSMVNGFIEHSCRWFLQHVPQPMDMNKVMGAYAEGIALVEKNAESFMTDTLRKAYDKSTDKLVMEGVPKAVATRIAKLEILSSACDIIDIARETKLPITQVGKLYFELGAALKLGWLRRSAGELQAENYWQQLAIKSLVQELYQAQRRFTHEIIMRYGKQKGHAGERWTEAAAGPMARYQNFIEELRTQQSLDYPMLIVALRQVQWIISQ